MLVGRACACPAVFHLRCIKVVVGSGVTEGTLTVPQLAAGLAISAQGKVEVLVSKAYVEAIREIGDVRTQDLLVATVNHAVVVNIFILEVARFQSISYGNGVGRTLFGSLVNAYYLITIVRVHLFTDFLYSLSTTNHAGTVFQVSHLIVQVSHVGTNAVREVFAYLVCPVQRQFHTGVEDNAIVAGNGRALHREGRRNYGIVRHTAVPVDITAQAIVQRSEVHADVSLLHHFPCQPTEVGGIGKAINSDVVAEYATYRSNAGKTCTGCHLVVTQLTPAGTQLQVVEDILVFHERLLRKHPCTTNGGEVAPLLIVLGRTIGTEREHQHIFVIVVVVQTGEV